MLGAVFAVLSAAAFALNNAMARRGVITGTPMQGMAVTIPIGVVGFLLLALASGEIARLASFPPRSMAWMAGVGIVHFVIGRYCNYSANQAVGVNLSAPVIQLQVVVTLVLAVVVLGEPCTVLQVIGGTLILAGSLITQRQSTSRRPARPIVFTPRVLAGTLLAVGAALAYGTSPIMARFALENAGAASSIVGGLLSYTAATLVVAVALLWPQVRQDVASLKRENVRWFAYTGIAVAVAQGLFYSALAVAPVMLVMPLLQTSLVFRFLIANWLSPDHEVVGWLVFAGVAVSLTGALAVSVSTDVILAALAVPEPLAAFLRLRVG